MCAAGFEPAKPRQLAGSKPAAFSSFATRTKKEFRRVSPPGLKSSRTTRAASILKGSAAVPFPTRARSAHRVLGRISVAVPHFAQFCVCWSAHVASLVAPLAGGWFVISRFPPVAVSFSPVLLSCLNFPLSGDTDADSCDHCREILGCVVKTASLKRDGDFARREITHRILC